MLIGVYVCVAPARACPLCNSDRAVEVRAALFSSEALPTLAAMIAPFAVLGVILPVVYIALRPRRGALVVAAVRSR
jgi:hypothetical protein